MNLIVLDTETSDLDPSKGAAILELAWMVIEHNGEKWKPSSAYETYIQYSGPISPHAQASHHIRADWLVAPRAVKRDKAVARLFEDIKSDSFIVAHYAEFDSKFLPELIQYPWICTYRAAKRLWPQAPGHSNQVLRYWLNINPDLSLAPNIKHRSPHQALYDVATTTGILLKMLESKSPTELYQFNMPTRLQTIEFGKHKGKSFENIPRDYLAWLRNQPQLDQDLKFTLDSILQQS